MKNRTKILGGVIIGVVLLAAYGSTLPPPDPTPYVNTVPTMTPDELAKVRADAKAIADAPYVEPTPGKYDQTWSKNYGDTTCLEFKTTMTKHERWAAAADMLTSAWQVDGLGGMPSDELITTFRQGVETACVIDTMTVADTGTLLYLTEKARFNSP